jgi:hypothetical protein
MLVPPKQRMRIAHFDPRTQEDAFTVSLEGLKGVRSLLPLYIITNLNLITSVEYQYSCLGIGSGQGRPKKKGLFTFSLCDMLPYLNSFSISPLLSLANQLTERAQKTCEITSTAGWASTSSINAITAAATTTTASSVNTLWNRIYHLCCCTTSAYTTNYTHICTFGFGFVIKKAVHIGSSTRWNP